ncbi:MAG: hypothetical protein C4329_10570 [Chitinophagaceae bacterium]
MKKLAIAILALTLVPGVSYAYDGGKKKNKKQTECTKKYTDKKNCNKTTDCPKKAHCICS